jgi:ABC-type Co2+ transport system permease subunit
LAEQEPSDLRLVAKVWSALRADWGTVDNPIYYLVASAVLIVGCWFLLVEGANGVIGLFVLPVAALAVYRLIRSLKMTRRSDAR